MWVKSKAIPVQAWTDAEGSMRLRLQDFQTFNLQKIVLVLISVKELVNSRATERPEELNQ
jgi:hypothetical protein